MRNIEEIFGGVVENQSQKPWTYIATGTETQESDGTYSIPIPFVFSTMLCFNNGNLQTEAQVWADSTKIYFVDQLEEGDTLFFLFNSSMSVDRIKAGNISEYKFIVPQGGIESFTVDKEFDHAIVTVNGATQANEITCTIVGQTIYPATALEEGDVVYCLLLQGDLDKDDKITNLEAISRDYKVSVNEVVIGRQETPLDGVKVLFDPIEQTGWLIPDCKGEKIVAFNPPMLKTDKQEIDLTQFNIDRNNFFLKSQYSFEKGFTLQHGLQTVIFEGQEYRWGGEFPKVVLPESGLLSEEWKIICDKNRGLLVFQTVDDMIAHRGFVEGDIIQTNRHKVNVISNWGYTLEVPMESVFYLNSLDGGYLVLLTPNFASAGVIEGDIYNPTTAWRNRNIIQKLLRDQRFNNFKFGSRGVYYILGSITPNRNDITLEIEAGCDIRGRYDDPSIPDSTTFQTGGLFDMTQRNGIDVGDMAVTGETVNNTILLNGVISTEYNTIHTNKNNNNVFGFMKSVNCRVIGVGGIKASDHKGVCFDGDAVCCEIDIAYIKDTMDEPFQMKGKVDGNIRNKCVSKIKEISTPFGGNNVRVVGFVSGCSHDIHIDKFDFYSNTGLPVFIGAFGAHHINIFYGEVRGCSQIGRCYNTDSMNVYGGVTWGVESIVVRAGDDKNHITKSVKITGVRALDNNLKNMYKEDTADLRKLQFLEVSSNNLFPASTELKYINANNQPENISIYNNIPRNGMSSSVFNPLLGSSPVSIINTEVESFQWNINKPDFQYGKLEIYIKTPDGVIYSFDLNVLNLHLGGFGAVSVTTEAGIVDVTLVEFLLTVKLKDVGTGNRIIRAIVHN